MYNSELKIIVTNLKEFVANILPTLRMQCDSDIVPLDMALPYLQIEMIQESVTNSNQSF